MITQGILWGTWNEGKGGNRIGDLKMGMWDKGPMSKEKGGVHLITNPPFPHSLGRGIVPQMIRIDL